MFNLVEVKSRSQLLKFVRFPDELYRNCPQYVPALHSDQIHSLTKSPSLKYCTNKLWLAEDGGRVVGRICAMINPRFNERYSRKSVRFGWFDCINDIEVAPAPADDAWYTLNGMKLESKPTEKGVYIYNGRKVVIK